MSFTSSIIIIISVIIIYYVLIKFYTVLFRITGLPEERVGDCGEREDQKANRHCGKC